MAYFAKINDGIVTDLIEVKDEVLLDKNNEVQESRGIMFCYGTFGGNYVRTFEDGSERGKFAEKNDIWDGTNFISPTTEEGSN